MTRLLLSALLLVALLAPGYSTRADITVTGTDGPVRIPEADRNGVRYLNLSLFAKAHDDEIVWLEVGARAGLRHDKDEYRFLLRSQQCLLNDSIHDLGAAVFLRKGQLWAPAQPFLDLWDRGHSTRPTGKSVTPNSPRPVINRDYDVSDLIISRRANGLLIELYLTAKVSYDIFLSEGNWMNISMPNAKVFGPQIESRFDARFFTKVRTHQVGSTGQVSLQFRSKIETWYHKYLDDPRRIQIIVVDTGAALTAIPATQSNAEAESTGIRNSHKGTSADQVDVVVVDAGHGGQDNGAIGPSGTREKDITLQIAKQLQAQLTASGKIKVVMTRETDATVSLAERARIANSAGADLFVSVHCNANPKRTPRGWNIFFLAPARNDSARSVAQFENSYFVREMGLTEQSEQHPDGADPIASILNEMIMTEFQAESQEFALAIDAKFRSALEIPARGVDQAGFFVLNKIFMPSVLVETAFISNKTEEKLLRSIPFQNTIAKSIASAILEFQAKYNQQ